VPQVITVSVPVPASSASHSPKFASPGPSRRCISAFSFLRSMRGEYQDCSTRVSMASLSKGWAPSRPPERV
jgi:hypothetical protein